DTSIRKYMEANQNSLLKAMETEKPLITVGVLTPLIAMMAEEMGFKSIYLSGAALSSKLGLPDLGLLSLEMICEEARSIIEVCKTPLIVDIDSGWDHPLLIRRAANQLFDMGVSAIQIEDQIGSKRCGHRPNKKLVSTEKMCERIHQANINKHLAIIARTDSLSSEDQISRCLAYQKAGADILFVEAIDSLETAKQLKETLSIPLMFNLTEFGKTPLLTQSELSFSDLLLYPMSVTRVMYQAAKKALKLIRDDKQQELIPEMLTRDELYQLLDYQKQETLL
ncbi:isocitrate lyase/phosphoenolpyruvate mutase family protein, partial [Chlamydiales bacterium]|nr:isocitrate lyase/phosphoenolpyruvate mutase family protein [Chlamydiales bacterium]